MQSIIGVLVQDLDPSGDHDIHISVSFGGLCGAICYNPARMLRQDCNQRSQHLHCHCVYKPLRGEQPPVHYSDLASELQSTQRALYPCHPGIPRSLPGHLLRSNYLNDVLKSPSTRCVYVSLTFLSIRETNYCELAAWISLQDPSPYGNDCSFITLMFIGRS